MLTLDIEANCNNYELDNISGIEANSTLDIANHSIQSYLKHNDKIITIS